MIGKARGHRQHQIFVDHRGRALRRHFDAAQFRGADAKLRHRLAGIATGVAFLDRGAHLAQRREQPGTKRIGHDIRQHDIGTFHDQGRHDRECRRGRIGRHHHLGAVQFGLPGQRDSAAMATLAGRDDLRAKMLQHQFGMVAAGLGFDHGGDTGRR
jgi:hypothetical protein